VTVVVAVLLALGVAAQLTAVVGVLVGGNVYDRLHFTAPASMLVAVLVLGLNPILVHATARAAYVRERGSLDSLPER
jgi:multisubunit Na+/H+ antiporter MnhG subunit